MYHTDTKMVATTIYNLNNLNIVDIENNYCNVIFYAYNVYY